jgi:hypothetical protein
MKIPRLVAVVAVAPFAATIPMSANEAGSAEFQERRTWNFAEDGVSFSNEFSGARLNGAERTDAFTYQLSITPEARPINNSAWFAFRVVGDSPREITITLSYRDGTHRYRPKVSLDGNDWQEIEDVTIANRRRSATFRLMVDANPRVVAGQPLITVGDQMDWAAGLAELPFVDSRSIGRSVQGRPVPFLSTSTSEALPERTLILMAGQHPPEVTSVQGFRPFVEAMLGDSELAVDFRRHFNLAIFPLMNPDGWHHGHWRCNANGLDTNRTWVGRGRPDSPEVAAAIQVMLELPSPVAFFDFHSTRINVFYTGTDDDHEPRHFVPAFERALAERIPQWPWTRQASSGSGGTPSRSWGTRELKIPSITWEWADVQEPGRLAEAPAASAEEMMKLLLRLWRDDTGPAARFAFEPGQPASHDHAGRQNAATAGSPEIVTSEAAHGRGALSLAAPGSQLIVPDFDYGSADGATIAMWFRMSPRAHAAAGRTYLFSHGPADAADRISIHHCREARALRVELGTADTTGLIAISENSVLDDAWHHLAVVLEPTEGTRVFLNGIHQGSAPAGAAPFDPAGPLRIGTRHCGGDDFRFRGMLDDVRIHDRTLDAYDLTTIRHPEAAFD